MKINIKGVNYVYTRAGTGEPLILLHGFTGSKRNWDRLTELLPSRYEIVAVDLLGHGNTDKPLYYQRYSIANCADDMVTLVQRLGIHQFNLLGYSMGGRLALYIAIHYPAHIRSLILESASPGLKTDDERQQRCKNDNHLADQIEARGIQWFVDYWEQLPLWESQKQLDLDTHTVLRNQRLQNDSQGLANSLRGMGTGVQPSLWDYLAQLTIPVQLIAGELDTKFLVINREMLRHIPTASLSVIPRTGHTTHLEDPHTFAKTIQLFL